MANWLLVVGFAILTIMFLVSYLFVLKQCELKRWKIKTWMMVIIVFGFCLGTTLTLVFLTDLTITFMVSVVIWGLSVGAWCGMMHYKIRMRSRG